VFTYLHGPHCNGIYTCCLFILYVQVYRHSKPASNRQVAALYERQQLLGEAVDGEAHHVEVAAVNGLDKAAGQALDAVAARLVKGLAWWGAQEGGGGGIGSGRSGRGEAGGGTWGSCYGVQQAHGARQHTTMRLQVSRRRCVQLLRSQSIHCHCWLLQRGAAWTQAESTANTAAAAAGGGAAAAIPRPSPEAMYASMSPSGRSSKLTLVVQAKVCVQQPSPACVPGRVGSGGCCGSTSATPV
jgi:hypothetical protein